MKILIALTVLCVFVAFYVVWLRGWLRKQDWACAFFDAIEPIERVLWKKSETILFARMKIVIGLLLTLLTQAGTIDITPLMPFVPDQYEPLLKVVWNALPMTITVIGWMDERLRKDTTKPLEVVAMRPDAPVFVKEAAAQAEVANAQAVAVVQATKAA